MPFIKNSLKTEKKNNKNSRFSFWPYLTESCISFRKKFMIKFFKANDKFLNKFEDVWLVLGWVFLFFCLKNFTL